MNVARQRAVTIASIVAAVSAALAGACGIDGTTPDCTSQDSGCVERADGRADNREDSSPEAAVGPGDAPFDQAIDAPRDQAIDAPSDSARDASRDGTSDARAGAEASADGRPRDARADG
jgi:hypothetical protein